MLKNALGSESIASPALHGQICKTKNAVINALLECAAMAGVLMVAIFTTLIFGL